MSKNRIFDHDGEYPVMHPHTVERGDLMFIKCKTDKGMIRNMNQDYVLTFRSGKYALLIVADGMGGHNAGEVASKLAATSIRDYIFGNYLKYEDKEELLRDAIVNSNAIVYKEQTSDDNLKGMGTTTTCCILSAGTGAEDGNSLVVGHVGDSRAYMINNDGIRKITVDHSFVQELIKHGSITEDEAQNHPKRNWVTRAVGTEKTVMVDIKTEKIAKSDIILICSDGLTNYVSSEEICRIVLEGTDNAADELVRLANERGGSDNISVIIAGLEDSQ